VEKNRKEEAVAKAQAARDTARNIMRKFHVDKDPVPAVSLDSQCMKGVQYN